MANQNYLDKLLEGVPDWNVWRKNNPDETPDLSEANLKGANLSEADLSEAYLRGADLSKAYLRGAYLRGAYLRGAYLREAYLSEAYLREANLKGAYLGKADLSEADLREANLSEADLSQAILKDANLFGSNLSSANLATTKDLASAEGLKRANLDNTYLPEYFELELNKEVNYVSSELKKIAKNEDHKKLDGPKELFMATMKLLKKQFKGNLDEYFNLTDSGLEKLIEIAFLISFKKEELRYPKFRFYVPIKEKITSNDSNDKDKKRYDEIVIFKKKSAQKTNQDTFAIDIDLNNITYFTRVSVGIPQKNSAFLVQETGSTIGINRIIKIESDNEIFGELLNNQSNLTGLLLSIDGPGRLHLICSLTSPRPTRVQLAWVEGKVKIYNDPVLNPIANIIVFKLTKNLLESDNQNPRSNSNDNDKFNKKFYELTKIVQAVLYRILKLVVEFGHGAQFIILPKEDLDGAKVYEKYEKYEKSLDMGTYIEKQTALGESILKFFEHYMSYESAKKEPKEPSTTESEKMELDLLISYNQLLNCIDLIASLSTIDGSITLNNKLSLIAFGGETIIKNDSLEYKVVQVEATSNRPMFTGKYNASEFWHDEAKMIKFYLDALSKSDKKEWPHKQFGTRHRSAARLCTADELDPFIFVVSQTGDIREFMKLEHEGQKYVGVLGPLRPL